MLNHRGATMRLNSNGSPVPAAWTVRHACSMLLATLVAVWSGWAWFAAAVGSASLFELCVRSWGRWAVIGGFGAANGVTALRIGICVTAAFAAEKLPAPLLGLVVLVVFALDGLDGFLARRGGAVSSFGAVFDMEADAFFVAISTLLAYQVAGVGVWLVSAGLLRYGYVICLALVPARREELPRSRFGRWAFSLLVTALMAAFWLPQPWASALAGAGTAAVWLSFVRGFVHSYARASA